MSFRTALLAGLAAYAAASPLPQQLDLDAVLAQGPPATATIASTPGVISMAVTQLASAAAAEITAAPLAQATVAPETADYDYLSKRAVAQSDLNSTACLARPAQPLGAGPVPADDSDSGFLALANFSVIANSVDTPAGYSTLFTNLTSESSAYGYMGYTLLNSYSPATCAAQCDKIVGCQGINIAFERAPKVDPGTGCGNPPSTTLIKCVFWGSPNTKASATNNGQWRGNDFHVVIAGSNGYLKDFQDVVAKQVIPGYNVVAVSNNATVNAPTYDINGVYSYMGYKSWNDGAPFSIQRCAAACTAQSNYNVAHPPTDGSAATTCQFFATYYLVKNGKVQSQVCSMYTESWGAQYLNNVGYFYENDVYTIASSVLYSNATFPNNGVAA